MAESLAAGNQPVKTEPAAYDSRCNPSGSHSIFPACHVLAFMADLVNWVYLEVSKDPIRRAYRMLCSHTAKLWGRYKTTMMRATPIEYRRRAPRRAEARAWRHPPSRAVLPSLATSVTVETKNSRGLFN